MGNITKRSTILTSNLKKKSINPRYRGHSANPMQSATQIVVKATEGRQPSAKLLPIFKRIYIRSIQIGQT